MDNLRDLIFRYCVLLGRRFWIKEKIAFLRVLTKELALIGYKVDVTLAKLKFSKKYSRDYYNAYIGNVNESEIVLCTYYNTGTKTFNLLKKKAFTKNTSFLFNLIPSLSLLIIGVLLNILFFIPEINKNGILNFYGIFDIVLTLALFFFILRYKNGIPNRKNFCCNSSSIILFIHLINKLEKKYKNKMSFVLIDNDLSSDFGLRMFEDYLKNNNSKKIIFIDSITNGEQIQIFKPIRSQCLTVAPEPLFDFQTTFQNTLFISSGDLINNEIIIKNANTKNDNYISPERLEQMTCDILDICLNELKMTSSTKND